MESDLYPLSSVINVSSWTDSSQIINRLDDFWNGQASSITTAISS